MVVRMLLGTEHHGLQLFNAQEKLLNHAIFFRILCFQSSTTFLQLFHSLLPLRFKHAIVAPLRHAAINLFWGESFHVRIVAARRRTATFFWLPYAISPYATVSNSLLLASRGHADAPCYKASKNDLSCEGENGERHFLFAKDNVMACVKQAKSRQVDLGTGVG